jgi:hypothetical protein
MAQPFPVRRASIYRQRAHELTESAKQPRDECDRRHMLDQAAIFARAADALAPPPPPPPEPAWRRFFQAAQRLAERDRREAADTRTEAERWLGDPPPSRSALAIKH